MTTTFEAGRLYIPDTHSAACVGAYDIKVRPWGGQEAMILTSGLPQRATVYVPVPDFQQQCHANVLGHAFGRVERVRTVGRVFLVRPFGQCRRQPDAAPRRPSAEQQAKHQEHREYLQRVATERKPPLITQATAKKSWDLWLAVRKATGYSMAVPSAGTGPDGVMFYSWDKGEHHLEAEIFPDRDVEFFYRNRRTGELWGEDYAGRRVPDGLTEKLLLFV